MKGCPLSCHWCCNPESQKKYAEIAYSNRSCLNCNRCMGVCRHNAIENAKEGKKFDFSKCLKCEEKICADICPTKAIFLFGKDVTVCQLIQEIKKDEIFYKKSGGGITISGGEPFIQTDFVKELLVECKNMRYDTAIETCGYCDWENFEKVLNYIDLFLYDLKQLDDKKHSKYTGVSNRVIIENLEILYKRTKNIIIRVPVIPQFNSDEHSIRDICEFVKKLGLLQIHLLPYHRLGRSKYEKLFLDYKLGAMEPPSREYMQHLAGIVRNYEIEVQIGG